jgi:hypothetical protein
MESAAAVAIDLMIDARSLAKVVYPSRENISVMADDAMQIGGG